MRFQDSPGRSPELVPELPPPPPRVPEGPRIEKNQSREAILKKSSFQYRMKFSIENEIFIPGPSLAAEKQGLGLKFSIGNEIFKPRMKISSENENFVRGGMVFSCVRARMNFFDPRALWGVCIAFTSKRGFRNQFRTPCPWTSLSSVC